MLFRTEAITFRADRLTGDVAIVIPVAWQTIGTLLFVSMFVAILFLSVAHYERVETVFGSVVPDAGVSLIQPSRSGTLTKVFVREGTFVHAGQELAAIKAEEDSAGGPIAARIVEAIAQQDASLSRQATASGASAVAQQSQLISQSIGLRAEIAQLQSQISIQRNLIDAAERDLGRAKTVAERGFISGRDLQIREETLLSRRQGLAQLSQSLASRQAALDTGERSSAQIAAQARAQAATIGASRAQVAQQAANTAGSRAYVLRAPVSGRVAAMSARVGQLVSPQATLMSIIPAGSTLRAELAVPTTAIGFVKPGQDVRLAIDAFPYQRFGTIEGKVQTVATTAVGTVSANGSTVPVYPVTVVLSKSQISAFGRKEALV